jgi:hypothetical protein
MANPNLQMFRSDIPTTEIGIESNPIDFGFCMAGQDTVLPYDILLCNDKGAVLGSEDAKSIYIELIKLYVSQSWTSTGLANQTYNTTYYPIVTDSQEVTVDGDEWTKVSSLIGQPSTAEVYTFNLTTGELIFGDGVNGKIPPFGLTINIVYTPDLDIHGKTIYSEKWVGIRSSGIVSNDIHVTTELATKIDDSEVSIIHFPYLSVVTGAWDNPGKTGTNYYTGGSFDSNLGHIALGTPCTGSNIYVEYDYRIKDDGEVDFTNLGDGDQQGPLTRIPKNNCKRLQMKITVPATANTVGGAYIQAYLRAYYSF